MTDADVIIVGGGLNGGALALALARSGVSCVVIDAVSRDAKRDAGFDGRSYALSLASVRMLGALGLWDGLRGDAQPILEIKVSDGRAGEGAAPFGLHFDHAELEEGPMGQMIEDRHLRATLLSAIDETDGVRVIDGAQVISQSCEHGMASVTLESGQTLAGRLLVAADGRQGPTALRAGITRQVTDYGQSALVCAVAHSLPHHGIAHQFFMPAGPLAILPLSQDRSSIVWSETRAQAAAIQRLNDEDYLKVLRPRFGDFLGEIAIAGARYSYPLNMTLASAFTGERLALVGDAARGVHPIAGQGLNAGLRDVASLAEVAVLARRRGEDIGRADVLDRYARWRRFDTATLAFATDGFNRLFSNDNPVLRLGRDLGMGLIGGLPGLRRRLMREAAGLTGDLPSLTKGRQI